MKNKISIIIPIYNVENYLNECLQSCVEQTLKEIEIICINDCSPDNSEKILQNYSKIDSRIKIFKHEKNLGLGAARNTGLKYATGEYIWFIDSDDFIEIEACQLLYDTALNNNVDVLLFQAKSFINEGSEKKYIEDKYYNELPQNININLNKYIFNNFCHIPVTAWSYISKRDFINNYSFRTGVYYEDTDYTPILLNEAKSVRSISYTAYNRRINPNSITQTSLNKKKIEDKFEVVKALDSYIHKNNITKNSFIDFFIKAYNKDIYELIRNSSYYEDISLNPSFKEIYGKTIKERIQIICKKFFKMFLYILPYGLIKKII